MQVEGMGIPVQIPNTNGAFFSGAARLETEGTIPADDEVNITIPLGTLVPNRFLLFKMILAAIKADGTSGINEYNGLVEVDQNGDVKGTISNPLTGGSTIADVTAALSTGPPLAIEVENTDIVNATAYRIFATWTAFQSPYDIAP